MVNRRRFRAPVLLCLVAMVAPMQVGCEVGYDPSVGVMEDQPIDPCNALWYDVYDECMAPCIGIGCLEMTQPCSSEANYQYAQCCQGLGLTVSFDPVRSCTDSP
jgi:hypothetical protein